MATKDRYITTNFSPAEPEEFKKWCKENKIEIHPTEYGKDVYLTTSKLCFTSDNVNNPLVRFTKNDNRTFRTVIVCKVIYKGNYITGCEFYRVDDSGVKSFGGLSYTHNMSRFFNAIMEEARR